MRFSSLRHLGAALFLVSASFGMSAIDSASASSVPHSPLSALSGMYRGVGSGLSNFTFKVGAGQVTGLSGDILMECSAYFGDFVTMTLLDTHAIKLSSSRSFFDTNTVGSGTKRIITTVSGKIDSSGHAAGTVHMKTVNCDSNTVKWAATARGVAPVSTSSSKCSPRPCGIQDGLILYVVRTELIPSSPYGGTHNFSYNSGGVDVTFRLVNKSSSTVNFTSTGDYAMQPGNNAELVTYNGGSPGAVQSHCPDIGVITLDPGSVSQPQHLCFPFDSLGERGTPLTLKFRVDGSPNPMTRVQIGVVHAVETSFWK